MSKPYGMTARFQIIRPTPIEDAIWDAVVAAIDAGITVEEFRQEAKDCWREYLREKADSDSKSWATGR